MDDRQPTATPKKARVISTHWLCPKEKQIIDWRDCRWIERSRDLVHMDELDCWSCPNLLKLRRAEYAHREEVSKKPTAGGIAIVLVLAAVVLAWIYILCTVILPLF